MIENQKETPQGYLKGNPRYFCFILSGGSTNDDLFLSTDDPGGGRHPIRSPSNTMDNKDNLDDGSTNDDPGFRGNSNTSNTQQAVSDTHESRVSPYLVTRDPSLKPTGALTNTMDKDGLWCDGLCSSGKKIYYLQL